MNARGMTLIEVMFAMSIFTVVMGSIFMMAMSMGDTAEIQEIKTISGDEGRRVMQTLIPDLHQAIRQTVNWDQLPGETLTYSVPEDLDGNGTAVDVSGDIEMSAPRVISRDEADINNDGFASSQFIVTSNGAVTVLANHLSPESEQTAADGSFPSANDTNGNGQVDRGLWFEPWGQGIRVTVQMQGVTRQGHVMRSTFQEIVFPRN